MRANKNEEIETLRQRLKLSGNSLDGLRLFDLQRPDYSDVIHEWQRLYEQK
jgi:hypothetical protein